MIMLLPVSILNGQPKSSKWCADLQSRSAEAQAVSDGNAFQSKMLFGFNSLGDRHSMPLALSLFCFRSQKVCTDPKCPDVPSRFISPRTSVSTSVISFLYFGSQSFASHLISIT